MSIIIKPMETEDEIRGKAFVHWKGWQETYPGMMSRAYLDAMTLEKCEENAFRWPDNILVAKDGNRVVGFVGYGKSGDDLPDTGEIFALYVLSEYHGTGLGRQLLEVGFEHLAAYPRICLWALKDNARAIRFYEKCGFRRDGAEKYVSRMEAAGIRMIKER